MVQIKVFSSNKKHNVDVEVKDVPDESYELIRTKFLQLLKKESNKYKAITEAFIYAVNLCPKANPSDIWHHILYRIYLKKAGNEQSWKRTSGQAFEEAFAKIYNPRLIEHRIRLVVLKQETANRALKEMKLNGKIEHKEIDVAIEGNCDLQGKDWKIFGMIHFKASAAERIKDDVPASRKIMAKKFISLCVTLDVKSYPPPKDVINYGEFGGRNSIEEQKPNQQKRNYFEKNGDFTNGYSYNLRTPPSSKITPSGSRIKTLSFSEMQPDEFVEDLIKFWREKKDTICKMMPVTKVS